MSSAFCGAEWAGEWTAHGDLQPCAQSLLLLQPPAACMILFACARSCRIRRRSVQLSLADVAPRLALGCSALLSLVPLIALLWYASERPRVPFQLTQNALQFVAWACALLVLTMERQRILQCSPGLRLFWLVDAVVSAKGVESAIAALVRGSALDDSMLLAMLRLPLHAAMGYYALAWRRRGLDDDAGARARAQVEAEVQGGGILHLNSPSAYALVDDVEYASPRRQRDASAGGLWGRFLQFTRAGNSDGGDPLLQDLEDDSHMAMGGVNHIDSASFSRPSSSRSPLSPTEAIRSNPSSHALYGCALTIPSVSESVIHRRAVIQFEVRLRIRSATHASGDDSVDTLTVWKSYSEFEGLHELLSQTCEKFSLASVPHLPPPAKAPYIDRLRLSLEIYLQQVLVDPSYFDDVAGFVNLNDRLEAIRAHVTQMKRQAERKAAVVEEFSPPLSSSLLSVTPAAVAIAPPTPSRLHSRSPGDWKLIGVSVGAWMRWEPIVSASSGSSSPIHRSRGGSLQLAEEEAAAADKAAAAPPSASSYVTFQIRVRTSRGEWNCHHLLSTLQSFRAALVSLFPAFPIPLLNVDRGWDRSAASLTSAKRVVEIFLQACAGTSYFECQELYALLAEQEHHSRRVTKDAMVECSDPTLLPAAPAQPAAPAPARTESVSIASAASASASSSKQPKRRADSSLASSLASVGHSINTAEESYFAAKDDSLAAPLASSPASAAPTPMRSPSLPKSSSGHAPRHSSPSLSSSVLHHASSFAASPFIGDGADSDSASGGEEDSDEELAEHERGSGWKGDPSSGILSAASSGQLVGLPQSANEVQRPIGNHRYAVSVPKWSWSSELEADDADEASLKKKSKAKAAKKHVVFHIVVREFFSVDQYLEWTVTRRFAEFDTLHRALAKQFAADDVPALPPKTFAKPNEQFLNQRQLMLELFLQKIINTTTFQVEAFMAFFKLNDAKRSISMGNLNPQHSQDP